MNEIWKAIEDYPNYEVSNLGNVRNKKTKKVLKPAKLNTGYLQVRIKDSTGVYRGRYVHRLVITTFCSVENMDNLDCNHRDENKENNQLDNLEWLSHKENCDYGTRNERIRKVLGKTVLCIETGVIYSSTMDAARQTGIDHSGISKCCRGIYRTCGGFHWKYID